MLFSSNLICGLSFHFYFSNTRLCCCLVAESCPTLLRPPWTLAHQASLSVGFCRQEYWSGFPFPSPGEGLKPTSPALADTFFTIESPAKPLIPLKGYFPLLARTSLEEKSSFMVGKKRMSCPKAIHLNMFFNFSSHHETSKNYVCVCVCVCMKVIQFCPILCDPMDYTVQGILQAWTPESRIPSPGDLPNPGIKPRSPALRADSLPAEPPGKPKNTGVGSLSLLQQIFLIQGLNRGPLHCRRILYQLSYLLGLSYAVWDLVPWLRMEPKTPALGAES